MERRWPRFILIMVFCVQRRHETWPCILFYCIWYCFKRTGFRFLDCFVVNLTQADQKNSFHGWDSPISYIVAQTEFHETTSGRITWKWNKSINARTFWEGEKNVMWTPLTKNKDAAVRMIYGQTISILNEQWARVIRNDTWARDRACGHIVDGIASRELNFESYNQSRHFTEHWNQSYRAACISVHCS